MLQVALKMNSKIICFIYIKTGRYHKWYQGQMEELSGISHFCIRREQMITFAQPIQDISRHFASKATPSTERNLQKYILLLELQEIQDAIMDAMPNTLNGLPSTD